MFTTIALHFCWAESDHEQFCLDLIKKLFTVSVSAVQQRYTFPQSVFEDMDNRRGELISLFIVQLLNSLLAFSDSELLLYAIKRHTSSS